MGGAGKGFGCPACSLIGLLLGLFLITGGCAGNWPKPYRSDGRSNYSTLGNDFSRFPRGVTIPPAGLGVDLVKEGVTGEKLDTPTERASWISR